MRYLPLLLLVLVPAISQAQYPIQAIPFDEVRLQDAFWQPRRETVRTVTLPHTLLQSEKTGRIKNFDIAGGKAEGSFCTTYAFDDSDVYKTIEGAALFLKSHPDPALVSTIDSIIERIAAAQEPDGYLYTWRTIAERNRAAGRWTEQDAANANVNRAADKRWEKEDQHSHELYNLGHLYEAAVAWQQATGKTNLLEVALKSADLLDKTFGPGKLSTAPGHQEIEIGLIKLYQQTGQKRFLQLAQFFLETRGYGDAYMQNHQKVRDQRKAVGHAVRAGYMFAAAADVTALTGDKTYMPALNAVWEDITGTKMYLTGGVGSTGSNEGFGSDYDLPNYSAYCETCSSIAFALWTQRMFQLTGDGKYIDILERTLYNALNAGLSLSGDRFFYPNPLESRKNVERSPWFNCACCPPNIVRFYAAMPGLLYAKQGNTVYANLFAGSKTTVTNVNSIGQSVPVEIVQETNYPWEGTVRFRINPAKPNSFTLKIRIPGWARADAVPGDLYSFTGLWRSNIALRVNGKITPVNLENGYASLERKWLSGDVVELVLPMDVRKVQAINYVQAAAGRIALQRGPVVYCLEGKDQPDERVLNLYLPEDTEIRTAFDPTLLGGVETLLFDGFLVRQRLGDEADLQSIPLKAIPYYAWANRGKDNMIVWLPADLRQARPLAMATLPSKSRISCSEAIKGQPGSVADQYLPRHSNDQENPFVHWWPHFGTTEWLQYDFGAEEQVGTARVFWFDDEAGGGGCRIPKAWRLLYLENGAWKPVYAADGFPVVRDDWSTVQFEPVKTTAMRLEITLQEGVSAGVHEWELY